ncbi:hypothetical protein P153DRAFT_353711 [Dothidotthia symphoricarpi CBS 119687]|uniref:Uncharacterized protein n=1 Tax=Dothidotthia symphoricarpi CBS 119687 TaxID=1392245 RepID=A0A6A6AQP2_9PLEO|nr:uncharacterized protein P153DRAFT_353711 [Dothidotthia symphoricarpi CBS 119687]KAF2133335.1 hypothetical protein P153DRAFT_353711 [Dothidotthia symphoricarpi CBS 119687]
MAFEAAGKKGSTHRRSNINSTNFHNHDKTKHFTEPQTTNAKSSKPRPSLPRHPIFRTQQKQAETSPQPRIPPPSKLPTSQPGGAQQQSRSGVEFVEKHSRRCSARGVLLAATWRCSGERARLGTAKLRARGPRLMEWRWWELFRRVWASCG